MKLGLLGDAFDVARAVAPEAVSSLAEHLGAWWRETEARAVAWLQAERARDQAEMARAVLRGVEDWVPSRTLDRLVDEVRRADRAQVFDEAGVRRLVAEDRRINGRGSRAGKWN